jgi:hypothetical protein
MPAVCVEPGHDFLDEVTAAVVLADLTSYERHLRHPA